MCGYSNTQLLLSIVLWYHTAYETVLFSAKGNKKDQPWPSVARIIRL